MLKFDRQGLVPTIIVDDATGDVLMVAFMNQEALQKTRETGYTHFFSRSRNTIWRKGEQSGNTQKVQDMFVNCEENSLLIRVIQHGNAACHDGYHSCYYRRLLPGNTYETVAERIFDPDKVYNAAQSELRPNDNELLIVKEYTNEEVQQQLEAGMRQLYGAYLYLRDHDLSEQSNTSRLLQEHSQSYLVSRLADELQELADVQHGEHVHAGKQPDTVLEGSQVGYWLFLIAATNNLGYNDFLPHHSLLKGYYGQYSEGRAIEVLQDCLSQLSAHHASEIIHGLLLGFSLIGWACAEVQISPVAPMTFDLDQMRRKGLVK